MIKAGTYYDIKSMLLQNVCLDGHDAYVVTKKKAFDYLLRDMAADCAGADFSLWRYERKLIPKNRYVELCLNMSREHTKISKYVKRIDEAQMPGHEGEVYVFMRDIQLAINTFAEMVDELDGDLMAAVLRFNDCYNAKRFFECSRDVSLLRNVERLEEAMEKPICLIDDSNTWRGPRFAFISLVLAYLVRKNDDEFKAKFFRHAMREQDTRFTTTKAILYWHYHEYAILGGAMKRFPSLRACGLKKRIFREWWIELSKKRAINRVEKYKSHKEEK